MMLLSRIRLVNWHFFSDVTVDLGIMSLLAGDNGSGKSTIIDALQYALVAKVQRIRFNAAAADRRTARTLESYTRAKVGPTSWTTSGRSASPTSFSSSTNPAGGPARALWSSPLKKANVASIPGLFTDASLEEVMVYEEDRFLDPRRFREQVKAAGAGSVPPRGSTTTG